MSPLIRFESATDASAISRVVESAFRGHPHSDGSESRIVTRLRADGDLSISLVAEVESEVIGHVAFSPVSVTPAAAAWYGLGPLAVSPTHQSRRIGSALVLRGLRELQAAGAAGCVVFGNAAFYGRFGFQSNSALVYPHGPKELFLSRAFEGTIPMGIVTYAAAFGAA
jgi:putative acetyltransferase